MGASGCPSRLMKITSVLVVTIGVIRSIDVFNGVVWLRSVVIVSSGVLILGRGLVITNLPNGFMAARINVSIYGSAIVMSAMGGLVLVNYDPSSTFLFYVAIMVSGPMVRSIVPLFLVDRLLVYVPFKEAVFVNPVEQRPKNNGQPVYVCGRCNVVIISIRLGSIVMVAMNDPSVHYYVMARGSIMAVVVAMSVYRARRTVLSTRRGLK